ncbi:MAG: GEVED domain-containing protein, partial [Bacteroidia bacterium]
MKCDKTLHDVSSKYGGFFRSTMLPENMKFLLLLPLLGLFTVAQAQQYEIGSSPPHPVNVGAGGGTGLGASFNVHAKDQIQILALNYAGSVNTPTYEIWYNKDSIDGPYSSVTTANGWVLLQSGSAGATGTSGHKYTIQNPLLIPAGDTYGFFFYLTGGNGSISLTSAAGGPRVWADQNARFDIGPNVGYAGFNTGYVWDQYFFPGTVTYEIVPLAPPVASFNSPDSVCVNTPYRFLNNTPPNGGTHKWYIDGVLESTDNNLNFTPSSTGSVDIKLVTTNIKGSDSITKTLYVMNPWRTPAANFMASKNRVEVLEEVEFIDFSTYCPNSWEWIISPDEYFDELVGINLPSFTYSSGYGSWSQNPKLFFEAPGTYEVCLVAENSFGKDTICFEDYILVVPTYDVCLDDASYEPNGVLTDNSFGPYFPNANCSFFISSCAPEVDLKISSFDLKGGDYLRIYDGRDNTGTPLWNVSAFPQGMTGDMSDPSLLKQLKSTSGYVFIEFETDANTATIGDGFKISWESTQGVYDAPDADYEIPSVVCLNTPATFMNTSDGEFLQNTWYVDNLERGTDHDFNYMFNATGTYDVKLVSMNCGGADSITQQVTVTDPTNMPTPGFSASMTTAAVDDIVQLFDTTSFCIDGWKWEITPSTIAYVNNTTDESQHPEVQFKASGCYDVKLTLYRGVFSSTVTHNCYIDVKNYCDPSVVSLNSDIGISQVRLANINNVTAAAEEYYTDYTKTHSTELTRGGKYALSLNRPTTSNPVTFSAWIDYNQDGIFQSSELVSQDSNNTSSAWMDSITVPLTTPYGGTRMRVGIGHASNAVFPCGPQYYGE